MLNLVKNISNNYQLLWWLIIGFIIDQLFLFNISGFPEHMPFSEFRHRFDILIPADAKPASAAVDHKQVRRWALMCVCLCVCLCAKLYCVDLFLSHLSS